MYEAMRDGPLEAGWALTHESAFTHAGSRFKARTDDGPTLYPSIETSGKEISDPSHAPRHVHREESHLREMSHGTEEMPNNSALHDGCMLLLFGGSAA
jgi:hypothetical protein